MRKRHVLIAACGLGCALLVAPTAERPSLAGPGPSAGLRKGKRAQGSPSLDDNLPGTGTDTGGDGDPPTTLPPPPTATKCTANFALSDIPPKDLATVAKINDAIKQYSQCLLGQGGLVSGTHYYADKDYHYDCGANKCEDWTLYLNVGELMTLAMKNKNPNKSYIIRTLQVDSKITSKSDSACKPNACDGSPSTSASCPADTSAHFSVHEVAAYNRVFQEPDPAGKAKLTLSLAVRDNHNADTLGADSNRSAMVDNCGDVGKSTWKNNSYSVPPTVKYPEILARVETVPGADACLYLDLHGSRTLPDKNKVWTYNLISDVQANRRYQYPSTGTASIPLSNGETYKSSGQTSMPIIQIYKRSECEKDNLSDHSADCGYDTDMAFVVGTDTSEEQVCPNAKAAFWPSVAKKVGALFPADLQKSSGIQMIAVLNGIMYAAGILDSTTKSVEWKAFGSAAATSSKPAGLTFKLIKRTSR